MDKAAGAIEYVTLIEYNNWANSRLLDTAEKIPADLLRTGTLTRGNALQTLEHMLDAEWVWRMSCIGQTYNDDLWKIEPFADLASLRAYWQAESQQLLMLVRSFTEADLERKVLPNWTDELIKIKYVLLHVVNHATNHRSEIGWFFHQLGYSPGDLDLSDYILFFRDK
jgi:uncharacterized damage-inducible protein DinB